MNSSFFNFTWPEVFQLISLILACLTCIYAIRTFIRNRKIELENHLFRIKIEALSNLTYEMDNFFIILNRTFVKLSLIDEVEDEVEKNSQLLHLSLDVDDQLYKCHSMIAKYSVFFSKESTEKLLEFSSNIIGKTDDNQETAEKILNSYYEKQLFLADNAQTLLRKELKLEKLNSSLHLRYY